MSHAFAHGRQLRVWLALGVFALVDSAGHAQTPALTGVVVNGRKYTGRVVFRDATTLGLLRRDGGFSTYATDVVDSERDLKKPFQPYPQSELEDRLRAEFPSGYSVGFAEHVAVVFPTESTFAWTTTFERLHRQFRHYFETRGLELSPPEFPLIAVVLRSRSEFDRELARSGVGDDSKITGYYSIQTNRIVTYDQSSAADSKSARREWATIVVHETAHQAAFNSGIHQRFRPVPRWVSEGLATMFEAPGIYDGAGHPRLSDRLPPGYWSAFQKLIDAGSFRGKIQPMVCSDGWFASDPDEAYAVAWGLTFFLAETQPADYGRYLRSTTHRDDFIQYSVDHRLADFCDAFGSDFGELESRIVRYFGGLRSELERAGR